MLHREGRTTLLLATALLLTALYGVEALGLSPLFRVSIQGTSLVLFGLVVQFFRNPKRTTRAESYDIIAPADGKVVVIHETLEEEFFKDKRIQVSIFMSPLNVHVNRYPTSGKIVYAQYHKGAYLVAWHPKASTLNERTTVVIDGIGTGPILYRQIAGALARRIKMYAKEGQNVLVGEESGFIQFGSRVDIFLPVDAEIVTQIGDTPRGGETVIARVRKKT